MIEFLFGFLLGHVMGFGVYTLVDKVDKQIRENNERE